MNNLELDNNLQTVLVVDDTLANIDLLKEVLTPMYAVKIATSGELALKIIAKQVPDIILLDVMMPGMDGYEVCKYLKSNIDTANIPIIFVTALVETHDEQVGFDLGAVDYITKPIQPALALARVKAQLILADQHRACEIRVQERTKELAKSQKDAIAMLGKAGHYNDKDTGVHIWRMAEYASALARSAQWPIEQSQLLELAAPMHDTGKIGIPDSILKAPRKLTADEWEVMKTHAEIGYGILTVSDTSLFQLAAEVAYAHHEKWDGSGYPRGLKGEDISESARIVTIADVFDALTMSRPYKDEWNTDKAFAILEKDSGSHFDKRLVDLFIAIKPEILEIKAYWDNKQKN
jgi:putative two-component system response regulator